jgi:hypothetical protein
MKKLSMIIALVAFTLSFSACEKDDEKPSKTAMLTAKTWKMTGFTVDPTVDLFDTGVEITNIYNQQPCFHDDTRKFDKSGTFTADEGTVKCYDVQTETGSWVFNPEETVITISADGESVSAQIIELSSTKLKVRYTLNLGIILTFEEEYTAI